ncbi:MAG: HAD domain-containing protein [Myxococcota bacterium]
MADPQMPLPLGKAAWERRWRRQLPEHRGRGRLCGPMVIDARTQLGAHEVCSRCERCRRSARHGGHVVQQVGAPRVWDAEPGRLLPCEPSEEDPTSWPVAHCEVAPGWLDALAVLCREVDEALQAMVDPRAQALCRRLAPGAREAAYRAAVQDPSGRVLQLVRVQPAAAAVVASAAPEEDGAEPWDAVVAGKALREVLRVAARRLGRDRPGDLQRLHWLVRRAPADAPPGALLEVAALPLITSDRPKTPERQELWLGAMMRLARALRPHSDPALRRCATRYVSRHYAELRDTLDRGDPGWTDLVLWMAVTERRPDRALEPHRLLVELVDWWHITGDARLRQRLQWVFQEMERVGRVAMPEPPFPGFVEGALRVDPITDLRRLYEEGAAMHHCIFNYHTGVFSGFCAAYSVRQEDARWSMLLVRDGQERWRIDELAGPRNRPPPAGLRVRLEAWLSREQAEDGRARPIVFVDIDGVLAPFDSLEGLDRECVARLDGLVGRSGAVVVVTSAWRERVSVDAIRQAFRAAGFGGRVVDVTPILLGRSRGEEIAAYLKGLPEKVPFVILDDEADVEALEEHLVQVDGEVGLQEEDVETAWGLLLSAEDGGGG